MAQNKLPVPFGALIVLAYKCAGGLAAYGAALGITQMTAASLTADAVALQGCRGRVQRRPRGPHRRQRGT